MAEKLDGAEKKGPGAAQDSGKKPPTFMCMVCGYISTGAIPAKCPGCGAGKENFKQVEE